MRSSSKNTAAACHRSLGVPVLLAIVMIVCSVLMVKHHEQVLEDRCEQRVLETKWMPPGSVLPHHAAWLDSVCEYKEDTQGLDLEMSKDLVAPVVIIAHKRVHYLAKAITTLLRYWEADPANKDQFPLFVSVDGGDHNTVQFAAAFHHSTGLQVIQHVQDGRCGDEENYCRISTHYETLLRLFFGCTTDMALPVERLILLEEDLEIAPDFFDYFAALAPVLDHDPSLMCVSAWNDNGQHGRAVNTSALYRTDVFPGLGWMLGRGSADELLQDWPLELWDEHLRRPDVRRGRQCIFPEVARTHTYGKQGTSLGEYYDHYLGSMVINGDRVDWGAKSLSYLEGPAYASLMSGWLAKAHNVDSYKQLRGFCRVDPDHTPKAAAEELDMLVHYSDNKTFSKVARDLYPMMRSLKGGWQGSKGPRVPHVPRASYNGTVIVRCQGRRLFITPEPGSPADPASWPAVDYDRITAAAKAAAAAADAEDRREEQEENEERADEEGSSAAAASRRSRKSGRVGAELADLKARLAAEQEEQEVPGEEEEGDSEGDGSVAGGTISSSRFPEPVERDMDAAEAESDPLRQPAPGRRRSVAGPPGGGAAGAPAAASRPAAATRRSAREWRSGREHTSDSHTQV